MVYRQFLTEVRREIRRKPCQLNQHTAAERKLIRVMRKMGLFPGEKPKKTYKSKTIESFAMELTEHKKGLSRDSKRFHSSTLKFYTLQLIFERKKRVSLPMPTIS